MIHLFRASRRSLRILMGLVSLLVVGSACEAQDPSAADAKKQSRFIGEIGTVKHPEGKPVAEPLSIRFDFSGKRVYAFDYTQQAENLSTMSGMPKETGPVKQKMDLTGTMVLKSKGDKTGTLVLKALKASVTMEVKKEEPPRTMQMEAPTMAVPDVKEDGSMDGGAATAQPLLKLTFPMPPKPLKPGESVEVPVTMPFNAMGSMLTVKGTAKITHAGYFNVAGKNCARLDVETDISKLDVPKEIEGKYVCAVKGRSVYFFDVESQEFESGDSAMLMKMQVEGKMPKVAIPQQDKPADFPKSMQMTMEMDSLTRLKRNPEVARKETEGK